MQLIVAAFSGRGNFIWSRFVCKYPCQMWLYKLPFRYYIHRCAVVAGNDKWNFERFGTQSILAFGFFNPNEPISLRRSKIFLTDSLVFRKTVNVCFAFFNSVISPDVTLLALANFVNFNIRKETNGIKSVN